MKVTTTFNVILSAERVVKALRDAGELPGFTPDDATLGNYNGGDIGGDFFTQGELGIQWVKTEETP